MVAPSMHQITSGRLRLRRMATRVQTASENVTLAAPTATWPAAAYRSRACGEDAGCDIAPPRLCALRNEGCLAVWTRGRVRRAVPGDAHSTGLTWPHSRSSAGPQLCGQRPAPIMLGRACPRSMLPQTSDVLLLIRQSPPLPTGNPARVLVPGAVDRLLLPSSGGLCSTTAEPESRYRWGGLAGSDLCRRHSQNGVWEQARRNMSCRRNGTSIGHWRYT